MPELTTGLVQQAIYFSNICYAEIDDFGGKFKFNNKITLHFISIYRHIELVSRIVPLALDMHSYIFGNVQCFHASTVIKEAVIQFNSNLY